MIIKIRKMTNQTKRCKMTTRQPKMTIKRWSLAIDRDKTDAKPLQGEAIDCRGTK